MHATQILLDEFASINWDEIQIELLGTEHRLVFRSIAVTLIIAKFTDFKAHKHTL
jgi:hypothetical protein